jgi:beta-phosphoglucomutase-like phosphatase (HAD superfamily)
MRFADSRVGSIAYRCLLIDHDDTSVMSTPLIHYPAHVEALRRIRPGTAPIDLDGWFRKNFHPGLQSYLEDELGLSPVEIEKCYHVWRDFTSERTADFFPGMIETLSEFRRRGGIVVVVSHSEADTIERDYRAATSPALMRSRLGGYESFHPDLIFGWSEGEDRRKPHPWPVQTALERFHLAPEDVLVLDDLKPGADMAAAAGVDFAAALWGHAIPEIRNALKACSRWHFETVEEFRDTLLI